MTASHTAVILTLEAARRHLRYRCDCLTYADKTDAQIDLAIGHSLERARNPEVQAIGQAMVRRAQTWQGLR